MKNESILIKKLDVNYSEEPFEAYYTYKGQREYSVYEKENHFYLLTFPNGAQGILKESIYNQEVYDPEGGGPMEYYEYKYYFSYKPLHSDTPEKDYQSIVDMEWPQAQSYNPCHVYLEEERVRMFAEKLWYREVLRQDRKQLTYEVLAYYTKRIPGNSVKAYLESEFGLSDIEDEIQDIIRIFIDEILSMCMQGLSVSAILSELNKHYGLEFPEHQIFKILANNIERIQPMHSIYPVLYLDAFSYSMYPGRDIIAYFVMGISADGNRHVLGIQFSDTDKLLDGVSSFLEKLKHSGLQHVDIICSGVPDDYQKAVCEVFPEAIYLKSIQYLKRHSTGGIAADDMGDFSADLKAICNAANETDGHDALEKLKSKWSSKYAYQISWWSDFWNNVNWMFQLSPSAREVIFEDLLIEERLSSYSHGVYAKGAIKNVDVLRKRLLASCLEPKEEWKAPILNWESVCAEIKQALMMNKYDG